MRLHENPKLFDQAIRATAQHKQLREIYIEKDYWVTFALYTIFNSEIGTESVFKGGTALSKCFGLIQRFSEDIDLVVLKKDGESANRLTSKIRSISKVVASVMPEIPVEGITQKRGMNRKTGHSYPKVFKGDFGQVRDVIIVEATWLGNFEPYTETAISSFIYEMMVANDQQKMAEEYGLIPFEIKVLDPRRTICEKIMSLVRFSYSENPIEDLRNKVRHIYDLTQLLKVKDLIAFFHSEEFDKMLLKVAHDDVASYRNNNEWLANHPQESPLFSDLNTIWSKLKTTYSEDFRQLVYGELPSEKEVLSTLELISGRILSITWTIKLS